MMSLSALGFYSTGYYILGMMENVDTDLWRSTTKGTACRPGLFWDNEQNTIVGKIKGNADFVKVVFNFQEAC